MPYNGDVEVKVVPGRFILTGRRNLNTYSGQIAPGVLGYLRPGLRFDNDGNTPGAIWFMEQRRCKLCRERMGYTYDKVCAACLKSRRAMCPCGCGQEMPEYTKGGKIRPALNMSHYNKWQRDTGVFGDEWKKKIGEKSKGRMTPEIARKASETRAKRKKENPDAYKLSPERRAQLSARAKREWAEGKLGYFDKPGSKERFSKTIRAQYASGLRTVSPKASHGKKSVYQTPHGEKILRSSWELRAAQILDKWFGDWYYEPGRFKWESGTYLPDFYIPSLDLYLEIKGYASPVFVRKFSEFKREFPSIKIELVQAENLHELESSLYRVFSKQGWVAGRLL